MHCLIEFAPPSTPLLTLCHTGTTPLYRCSKYISMAAQQTGGRTDPPPCPLPEHNETYFTLLVNTHYSVGTFTLHVSVMEMP